MKPSRQLLPWLPWLLFTASCSTPPKPPTVDESRKRPANMAMAVELQTCRTDLVNTRILAKDSVRDAEASRQALVHATAQQQAAANVEPSSATQRNLLVPVLFAFGSSQVVMPDADAAHIVEQARDAPLVLLRGRTDGSTASPAESAIARQRAAAVEAWLV